MSTRDEVEQLLELLMQKVLSARLLRDEESETEWIELADAEVVDARARLLALLAPEPEPSDAEIEDDEVDAAGEAIWASILGPRSNVPWDRQPRDIQARYRIAGRSALAAARAARQTGGEK